MSHNQSVSGSVALLPRLLKKKEKERSVDQRSEKRYPVLVGGVDEVIKSSFII